MKWLTSIILFYSVVSFAEVKICSNGQYQILDPHQASTFSEIAVGRNLVYETILKYNPLNKELVPFIVSNWEELQNGTEIYFYFKRDKKFNNSKYSVKAKDFYFSLNLYLGKVRDGRIEKNEFSNNIKEITLKDNETVLIKLHERKNGFIKYFAEAPGVLLSSEYHEELSKKNKLSIFYTKPVSTGSFKFKKLSKDKLELERLPNYHFGTVAVEYLTFLHVPNRVVRTKSLNNEICDMALDINVSEITNEIIKIYHNTHDRLFYFTYSENSPIHKILKDSKFIDHVDLNKLGQAFYDYKLDPLYKFEEKINTNTDKTPTKLLLYINPDVLEYLKNSKLFIDELKSSLLNQGFNLTKGKENKYDLAFEVLNIDGFKEKTELRLKSNSEKLMYVDVSIGINQKKIKDIYLFRSRSLDFTTMMEHKKIVKP